jgi:YesN/AraC family two-component response regulator
MAKSILIVDDEEIIRNVLRRKLEQTTSYAVRTADDGKVALEMFKEEPVDLVISDLLMKEMNGIELLRQLKRLEPGIPVIIITGYGTLDDAIEAIHLGAEDFIKKPFDINEVLETIEKTFRKLAEEADQREVIKYIESEDIHIVIPTQFDLLNVIINYIFSHLRARWLVTDEQLHDVKVCLYEGLTNAFEHGNLGITGEQKSQYLEKGQQVWRDFLEEHMHMPENQDKKIQVKLMISEEEMRVAIIDEGPGFDHVARTSDIDPEALFRTCGRGLLLIQSLMDGLEFNESGNEMRMLKKRIYARTED